MPNPRPTHGSTKGPWSPVTSAHSDPTATTDIVFSAPLVSDATTSACLSACLGSLKTVHGKRLDGREGVNYRGIRRGKSMYRVKLLTFVHRYSTKTEKKRK